SGADTVTGTKRTSATSVSCSPSSVPVNSPSTCTATVADNDSGTSVRPSGAVSFSSDASGTFSSGGTCTLPISGTNSCSVSYTPAAGSEGANLDTGTSHVGTHDTSTARTHTVAGTQRSTSTSLSCSPGSVSVNDSTTCTATVAHSSAAPGILPSFPTRRSSDLGTFSSGGTCTLPISGTNSCSVSYTPAAGSEGANL